MRGKLTKVQRRVLHRALIGRDTYMLTREAIQCKMIKRGYLDIQRTVLVGPSLGVIDVEETLIVTAKGRKALGLKP